MSILTRIGTPYLLSLALALPAFAAPGGAGSPDPLDAKHCVQLGRDDKAKAQTLTNICNEKIEIAWCHKGSKEKGTQNGVCGGDKYYRKHKTLDPGKSENNRFSLPLDAQIHFGACIGNYYTLKTDGNTGHYTCRPPKAAKNEAAKNEAAKNEDEKDEDEKDEAKKGKPSFSDYMFNPIRRQLREYEAAEREAAKKHIQELFSQCLDDEKSPACNELKQIIEKGKNRKSPGGLGIRG